MIVVVLSSRLPWRHHFLFSQKISTEILEPRVSLYLVGTVETKSVLRFSLNEFVYEISWLLRPSIWYVIFPNFSLHLQYLISQLLSRSSLIRSPSHHKLKSTYSHCKIVNRNSMVLATHYFWSHIAWRTRSVYGVIGSPITGYPKICQMDIASGVKDQIFGFNVSMKNTILVQKLQSQNHATKKEFFWKLHKY